jgi:hypothetical protein
VTSRSLIPLAIIAVLAFVLHLAGGMMLDRSQASGMIGAGSVVVDDEVGCAVEPRQTERSLPYD